MAEPVVPPELPCSRTGRGCHEVSAPCVIMDAMDTQSSTYSDDELTAVLAERQRHSTATTAIVQIVCLSVRT